jgi:hypothetical protein
VPLAEDGPAEAVGFLHRNGVLRIDHLVVLSPDGDRTTRAFGELGWAPLRTRATDHQGAPVLQTFFRAGNVVVELVAPTEPSGGDGPCAFFGLAFEVRDLERAAQVLGGALGPARDAVQPGRRIATLRHREVGMSVATAFMSPRLRERR